MHTALRYILYSLTALVILTVGAVAAAVLLLNPNDYKPQIENLAEQHTRLELSLQGDIGWSFMPLGLELNSVSARLDDAPFLTLDRLVARVGLLSLLKMQPSVHTFELQGMSVNLVRDSSGSGNWERILPESEDSEQAVAEPATDSEDGGALDFKVSQVKIGGAQVSYRDEGNGQSVILDDFRLQASDIVAGQAFPLSLQFHVANGDPQLDVHAELSAIFQADEALETVLVEQLDSRFTLAGAPFNGKQVEATLTGSINADLKNKSLSLSQMVVTLANVTMATDLKITQYSSAPAFSGTLSLAEFSLRELLEHLGQQIPPTSDPTVLKTVDLSADIGGEPGRLDLSALKLRLDDSRLTGKLSYTIDTGAVFARLELDKLNADRYLPPPAPETAEPAQQTASAPAPESDLLPLETLRALTLDLGLIADQLIVSGIPINQLKLNTTAANGLVQINPLSGQLYEGTFQANATVNTQTAAPGWQLHTTVSDVNTLPLLTQLAEMQQFSGLANITAKLNSSGNRVSTLRKNASGQLDFAIKQGKLEGTNMAALACEGIALTHKESIDTSAWPKVTPFEDLSGALTINGHTLNNTALTAQMKGMALEGQGLVDADKLTLDYKAGLRILGAIDDNPSCRINERLKNVVIPVKCKGELAGEKGLPCEFDTARFKDTLATMAKDEIKQKANEEIDRSREKLKDKAREKLKGLFN